MSFLLLKARQGWNDIPENQISSMNISNKRQSEVVIKLTNMWIHGVDSILDWRMKNRAAAGIKQTTYGVSIGGLPLQVAKTWQRKDVNTKLNGDQLKKGASHQPLFLPRSGSVLLTEMINL